MKKVIDLTQETFDDVTILSNINGISTTKEIANILDDHVKQNIEIINKFKDIKK